MKKLMKDIFLKLMFSWCWCHFYLKEWKLKNWKSLLLIFLHDKTEYVVYIINLKQALNNGLALEEGSECD